MNVKIKLELVKDKIVVKKNILLVVSENLDVNANPAHQLITVDITKN